MPENVLDRIVADVRRRLETYSEAPGLEEAALEAVEMRRDQGLRSLSNALSASGPALIAECKKASPSAGVIRDDFDPVALASAYAAGGAAAISVVTEPDSFHGDTRWLVDVRDSIDLPVLRKDFIVSRRQLLETAVLGADAVLLISRILDQEALAELLAAADELEVVELRQGRVFVDGAQGHHRAPAHVLLGGGVVHGDAVDAPVDQPLHGEFLELGRDRTGVEATDVQQRIQQVRHRRQ